MKYMQEGGFQNNSLMRLTLGLTLVLLLGFWATNLGMYFSRMSLRPSSVVAYYNGSEEDFRPARSAASMLETTHSHLPMMGLVLLFLTHLLIFVPLSRIAKVAFIVSTFASALLEEGGGWLVRFVSPSLAFLKVIGFLWLQLSIAYLIVAIGRFLLGGNRRQVVARSAIGLDRRAAGDRRAANADREELNGDRATATEETLAAAARRR